MRILLASAAAFALAASGAYAQGNGQGKGQGNGGGNAQAAAKSQGGGKPDRGPAMRAQQQGPGQGQAARGPEKRAPRAAQAEVRGKAPDRAQRQPDRQVERRVDRDLRGRDQVREVRRDVDRDVRRDVRRDGRVDYDDIGRLFARDASRGLIDGCPPGLAKKYNGCMPPGLARERTRDLFGYSYRPSLFGLSGYDTGRYFYDDGYLMRLGDAGRVSGYIPLLGGALALGNPWPSAYDSYALPDYYVDYYNLGGPTTYRYADNVIYRVSPEDSAITSIAALLTGNDIRVGQPMPMGYDVYNVPYTYRDRYYDTPNAYYRYSDGYVYRIDPETQLVAAAIDLLI